MASEDTRSRLEIDWLKTLAGALAAVSSAVLLSTLGAAGTVIGAALGSVVVTIGSALYSQGLDRSRQRLTQAQLAAARKTGDTRPGQEPTPAEAASPDASGWRQRLALLPWKRIVLLAAALFASAVVAITAFELVAGRSVASFTGGGGGSGGTTITRLGGGGSHLAPGRQPTSPPATTGSPSPEPTTGATPSEITPSDSSSSGVTPFGTSSTGVPSPTPSEPTTSSTSPAPVAPGMPGGTP